MGQCIRSGEKQITRFLSGKNSTMAAWARGKSRKSYRRSIF